MEASSSVGGRSHRNAIRNVLPDKSQVHSKYSRPECALGRVNAAWELAAAVFASRRTIDLGLRDFLDTKQFLKNCVNSCMIEAESGS